ncbi:ComF family protein [Fusobacterium sp. MFO224]|uniref:ComF family protein n=1 Tax=Fusobacterium sp. MFO224 TaxID=3378070 RepID=UPI003852EBBB
MIRKFIFSNKCCICSKTLNNNSYYICSNCKKKLSKKIYLRKFKNIYFLSKYDSDIKSIIKAYKFYNKKYIGFLLAFLIKKELHKIIEINNINLILPVPISNEKKIIRGFNQIEYILELLNIKYHKINRTKNTYPMSLLKNINARQLNIKSSFSIPFNTSNKNILIIDDIITTGSTIKEIKKEILKKGKPNSIFIFSLAVAKSFDKNIFSI